jgi:uncharacterized protein (TIGR00369 family)
VLNRDQELIHRFAEEKLQSLVVDTSPLAAALNASILAVDRAKGRIVLSFEAGPQFLQAMEVIQGGAVSAMLDFSMGFAVLAALPLGQSTATVNLNVSFLRAAHKGILHAEGEIERLGRTMAFTRARLVDRSGVPVATAVSTLAVISNQAVRS